MRRKYKLNYKIKIIIFFHQIKQPIPKLRNFWTNRTCLGCLFVLWKMVVGSGIKYFERSSVSKQLPFWMRAKISKICNELILQDWKNGEKTILLARNLNPNFETFRIISKRNVQFKNAQPLIWFGKILKLMYELYQAKYVFKIVIW